MKEKAKFLSDLYHDIRESLETIHLTPENGMTPENGWYELGVCMGRFHAIVEEMNNKIIDEELDSWIRK